MVREYRWSDQDEAMTPADLRLQAEGVCAELGLAPPAGHEYTTSEVSELRRLHRLAQDLGRRHLAIEALIRTYQRLFNSEREVQQLKLELRSPRRRSTSTAWIDAYWNDE